MAEKKKFEKVASIFEKTINIMSGERITRQFVVSVKPYDFDGKKGKYVNITRYDMAYGNKPSRIQSVNFDPNNEELKDAIMQALAR